jgi:hypothetical protein
MEPDYKTHKEALLALKDFEHLKGKTVIEKETGKTLRVASVNVEPYTWFEDGIEKTIGYDIRICFSGAMLFVRAVDFHKEYLIPQN